MSDTTVPHLSTVLSSDDWSLPPAAYSLPSSAATPRCFLLTDMAATGVHTFLSGSYLEEQEIYIVRTPYSACISGLKFHELCELKSVRIIFSTT